MANMNYQDTPESHLPFLEVVTAMYMLSRCLLFYNHNLNQTSDTVSTGHTTPALHLPVRLRSIFGVESIRCGNL